MLRLQQLPSLLKRQHKVTIYLSFIPLFFSLEDKEPAAKDAVGKKKPEEKKVEEPKKKPEDSKKKPTGAAAAAAAAGGEEETKK
jgi:hypothetical protein